LTNAGFLTFATRQRQLSGRFPKNLVYNTFKVRDAFGFGASSVRTVWGNIMVVKSDREGVVLDVQERDLYFIETLVHRPVYLLYTCIIHVLTTT
jgi:hypothetical protein